jgi:hypothetical protein
VRHMKKFTLILWVLFATTNAGISLAQEVAPVPPPRPENIEDTMGSNDDQNQDENTEEGPDQQLEEFTPPDYDGPPQPVTLSARAGEDGQLIPDGLEWRIYSIAPDENGQLQLLQRSEEAAPTFSLPAGPYIAHASFGLAQVSDTVTVQEGPNNFELILDVGGLKLNAMIKGDIAIPDRWLRFTVFSDSSAPGGRKVVAQAVNADRVLHLNAGTYSVVSNFGEINSTAKADLQVETGQLTSATLYHTGGIVTFKLVSEPGGEAIADTTWIIKDMSGQTLFEEKNAFPQTVLEKGEYILIAKLGTRVYNREFEVVPGLPREIEVITSAN